MKSNKNLRNSGNERALSGISENSIEPIRHKTSTTLTLGINCGISNYVPMQMQGMILLHDKQLQNLPGYYNDSRTTGE